MVEGRGSDDSSGLGAYLGQLNGSGELVTMPYELNVPSAGDTDLLSQSSSQPDSLAMGSGRSSLLSRGSSVASCPPSQEGPLLFEHFLVVGASEAAAQQLGEAVLSRRAYSMTDRMRRIFLAGEGAEARRRAAYAAGVLSPSRHTFDRTEDSLGVDPAILFRYPPEADPPPQAVNDFCLPVGGRVDYIAPSEEDTLVREIFYGQGLGMRGSRCFIFMLEDKTASVSEVELSPCRCAVNLGQDLDEELGIDTGRLYGICVVHPRLLRVPVVVKRGEAGGWGLGFSGKKTSRRGSFGSEGSEEPETKVLSFESPVCYAFITRFPFFEFFFAVLTDLITLEKLQRMEQAHLRPDETEDLQSYFYVPEGLLSSVLGRLTCVSPPRFGGSLSFVMHPSSIVANRMTRRRPPPDTAEHLEAAAEWAIPTLLSWLPVDNLVWLVSLLLCEVKVVVVGTEAGMVSCAVMGLLTLLRPLSWVGPLIP